MFRGPTIVFFDLKAAFDLVGRTAILPCLSLEGGINICSGKNLSDLEYPNDVMLRSEDSSKLRIFLHRLNDSVGTLRMRFTSS